MDTLASRPWGEVNPLMQKLIAQASQQPDIEGQIMTELAVKAARERAAAEAAAPAPAAAPEPEDGA